MVHNKNDVASPRPFTEEKEGNSDDRENGIIQPEWMIDEDGIPYCKMQTEFDQIIQSNLKKHYPYEFEKRLHCKHCEHYTNNDCYFPKKEIDKIEADRLSLRIRCELCGAKIDRLFSILMSLYYKEKFGVRMPVICCTCYAGLEKGTFEKNSKRRTILFAISLFSSIFFFGQILWNMFAFNWISILLFIVPFSFWGMISIRDIKSLYYLRQGRKNYARLLNAPSSPTNENEESIRASNLDDDDKSKPADGAFYSPGYTD
jgi:hypothetical protein